MYLSPLECIFLLILSKISLHWVLLTSVIYFQLHVFCLILAVWGSAFVCCGVCGFYWALKVNENKIFRIWLLWLLGESQKKKRKMLTYIG